MKTTYTYILSIMLGVLLVVGVGCNQIQKNTETGADENMDNTAIVTGEQDTDSAGADMNTNGAEGESKTDNSEGGGAAAWSMAGSGLADETAVDPRIKPIIGGDERDAYGQREQCILNGDCDLGFMCIDGVCSEAR